MAIKEQVLNSRQKKAIEVLANGYTRAEAAKGAGVTEKTIYSWLRDNEPFKRELGRAREAAFRAGVTQLNGYLERAIETLGRATEGEEISGRQIRAANYLINHGKAYTELAHFGEKLEGALADIQELKRQYETDDNPGKSPKPGAKLPTEKSRPV
jgi:hypothetical protein